MSVINDGGPLDEAPATAVYTLGTAPVAASAAPATVVRVFDGGSSNSPPPRLMPPWGMAPWRASTVVIMMTALS
ncbi:hypothetical protein [Limnohabitans sp.]|uniref:hypothetical protein n=1 Tax=Limnohabitans sp. TaxID=1907725 RepID=UPI0033413EB9